MKGMIDYSGKFTPYRDILPVFTRDQVIAQKVLGRKVGFVPLQGGDVGEYFYAVPGGGVVNWGLGDLTFDGTFYDLDMSAVVPVGAKRVLVDVTFYNDGLVAKQFGMVGVVGSVFGQLGGATSNGVSVEMAVGIDLLPGQKVSYNGDADVNWQTCDIMVLGWWY